MPQFWVFVVAFVFLGTIIGIAAAAIGFTGWSIVVPLAFVAFEMPIPDALFLSIAVDLINGAILTSMYAKRELVMIRYGLLFGGVASVVAIPTSLSTRKLLEDNTDLIRNSTAYLVLFLSVVFGVRGVIAYRKRGLDNLAATNAGDTPAVPSIPLPFIEPVIDSILGVPEHVTTPRLSRTVAGDDHRPARRSSLFALPFHNTNSDSDAPAAAAAGVGGGHLRDRSQRHTISLGSSPLNHTYAGSTAAQRDGSPLARSGGARKGDTLGVDFKKPKTTSQESGEKTGGDGGSSSLSGEDDGSVPTAVTSKSEVTGVPDSSGTPDKRPRRMSLPGKKEKSPDDTSSATNADVDASETHALNGSSTSALSNSSTKPPKLAANRLSPHAQNRARSESNNLSAPAVLLNDDKKTSPVATHKKALSVSEGYSSENDNALNVDGVELEMGALSSSSSEFEGLESTDDDTVPFTASMAGSVYEEDTRTGYDSPARRQATGANGDGGERGSQDGSDDLLDASLTAPPGFCDGSVSANNYAGLTLVCVISGGLSGFLGVGAGMNFVIAYISFLKVDTLTGTGTGCMTMSILMVSMLCVWAPEVNFGFLWPYLLCALPFAGIGTLIGSLLLQRLSVVTLNFTISFVLLIVGVVTTVQSILISNRDPGPDLEESS